MNNKPPSDQSQLVPYAPPVIHLNQPHKKTTGADLSPLLRQISKSDSLSNVHYDHHTNKVVRSFSEQSLLIIGAFSFVVSFIVFGLLTIAFVGYLSPLSGAISLTLSAITTVGIIFFFWRQTTNETNSTQLYADFSAKAESQTVALTLEVEENAGNMAFSDLKFNLKTHPHTLVAGETGAGKSTTVFNIIERLMMLYDVRILICEPAGIDWSQAEATTETQIAYVIDLLHRLMKQRQAEINQAHKQHRPQPKHERMVIIFEEITGVLTDLKLIDKQTHDKAVLQLAQLSRMARKTNINLIMVGQSVKAASLTTDIRNNLGNRFIHRSPNTVQTSLGVPKEYSLEDLPNGIAYSKLAKSLVEIPFKEEFELPLISIHEIEVMIEGEPVPPNSPKITPVAEGNPEKEDGEPVGNQLGTSDSDTLGTSGNQLEMDELVITSLLKNGMTANKIADRLGGRRKDRLTQIRYIKSRIDQFDDSL